MHPQHPTAVEQLLAKIELAGNRLPHPTVLFIYLALAILILSAICSGLAVQATHPINGESIDAVNLLSRDGLQKILSNTVINFTHFAPVGTVLVAIMGIGVAEYSGLLSCILRATVLKAPRQLLTDIVVLMGALSSLAADTGYVALIPLAAMVFLAAGRHPIAGIAAAFAGVSGGYSANLMIGPLDVMLAGISSEAVAMVAPAYEVDATGNYYFIVCSTLLITLMGTWVTEKIIAPRLGDYPQEQIANSALSAEEKKALKAVAVFSLLFFALLLWGLLPADGLLRDPDSGSILRSPFIKGIVTIIAFYAAICGLIFGRVEGSFTKASDFITGMEKSMGTMASYLVLMFFAAQFVSYFSWSQLGIILAINGAELIQSWQLGSATLIISLILLAALINLLIGSASAKWALIAPIFVPMLYLAGLSPEASQIAYRIGDSSTNIITPLMPYFGVVVAFVQRYQKEAGIGTIIATMLPYSIVFLIGWSLLLLLWLILDLPLGPGVGIMIGA